MANTFILSDESINDRGFRILTSGIDIKRFESNPVMLWMHQRDTGMGSAQVLPIGRWENIRKEDGKLMADPVFDENDRFAQLVKSKVENGFVRGASIGVRINQVSDEKRFVLNGQTRATVTDCEIYEASIVDVPSNRNTVQLFSNETGESEIPLLKFNSDMSDEMKQPEVQEALSAETKTSIIDWFRETFGIKPKAEEPEKSAEFLALEDKVNELSATIGSKEAEIAELKAQVEALKNAPGATVTETAEATDDAPVADPEEALNAEFKETYNKLMKKP